MRATVKPVLTRPCRSCDSPVSTSNTTGLCRTCWLNPAVRPRGTFAKSEPRDQLASAMRLVRLAAEGARGQDPGEGLAPLLDAARELAQLVNDVGRDLVAQVGPQVVADDLGWSKQRVWDRWGNHREQEAKAS